VKLEAHQKTQLTFCERLEQQEARADRERQELKKKVFSEQV
jgi:hypothetical protein